VTIVIFIFGKFGKSRLRCGKFSCALQDYRDQVSSFEPEFESSSVVDVTETRNIGLKVETKTETETECK
jgi:hypothetical protein